MKGLSFYELRRKVDDVSDQTKGVLPSFYLSVLKAGVDNYLKFVVYCAMLVVPLYAITMSVVNHNWVMVFIDALIIPIGFVHGLLLLVGLVN